MMLNEFVEKWQGKYLDFDGMYGVQCMDLMHQYCVEVLGLSNPKILAAPGAKDVYNNFENITGHEYFEKIPNSLTALPLEGDILFWDWGNWGHVAICVNQITQLTFYSFDANYPNSGDYPHIQKHTYSSVLGWLRFKKDSIPQSPELTECLKQHGELVDKCNQKDKLIEEMQNETEGLKAQIITHENFQKQVSSTLNCPNQPTDILGQITKLLSEEDQLRTAIQTAETLKKSNENMDLELKTKSEANTKCQLELKTVLGQVQTVEGHAKEWQGKYETCNASLKFKQVGRFLKYYICVKDGGIK